MHASDAAAMALSVDEMRVGALADVGGGGHTNSARQQRQQEQRLPLPLPEHPRMRVEDEHSRDAADSPRALYMWWCARLRCAVLPSVVRLLPNTPDALAPLTSLDLSRLYVGTRGAYPVLALCARLPQLRHLDLSDNYLDNDTVWHVAHMAAQHPTLASLELRANAAVSWSGAMCLAQLVRCCPRVTHVGIGGTHIDVETAEALFAQTRQNAVASFAASGRVQMPSEHATAIHIRAMRRFFAELLQRDDDDDLKASSAGDGGGDGGGGDGGEDEDNARYVSDSDTNDDGSEGGGRRSRSGSRRSRARGRSGRGESGGGGGGGGGGVAGATTAVRARDAVRVARLYDGLVERLRVLGKLHEAGTLAPRAFARLRRAAPGPFVHWDAFLVLLFVEQAFYSQKYVDRLRRAFAEFNLNAHARDVYVDGFADAGELARFYTRVHGIPPRPHEVQFLYDLLSLQPHMTMSWDDFLYVMYIRTCTLGARAVGVTHTPMSRPACLLHY